MAKTGFRKSSGWVAIILFSRLLTVIAQQGFLSIDCGGKSNYTDQINIEWVPDSHYIDVGETAEIGVIASQQSSGSYLHSLRFFNKTLKKSCYNLSVTADTPYLLRLWFAVGNYTGFSQFPIRFAFSIETLGLLTTKNLTIKDTGRILHDESIFVSSSSQLYICLIRTFDDDDPFINAIELRILRDGMYQEAKPGTLLRLQSRYDIGGNLSVRYPEDQFDRIWAPGTTSSLGLLGSPNQVGPRNAIFTGRISTTNTEELPPPIVMQTALVADNNSMIFGSSDNETGGTSSIVLIYFAEVETLNMSKTRSFSVVKNPYSESHYYNITIVRNYSASELRLPFSMAQYECAVVSVPSSSYGPIVNAFEAYAIVETEPRTSVEDINALNAIKTSFDIKGWISDPCYVVHWDGINCDKSSPVRRISELNLSEKKLAGLVPQNIGIMTALVNLSLDNNNLMGPLPNFSKLIMLERLHLQNNRLNGTVPDWLAGLKNLKELFIENNNFSGEIPVQLLKASLTFRHTGNRYLYYPPNSNKHRLKLILGITISGSLLVIALMLVVGVLVHRKKSRRKESSKVEEESKHAEDEDNSMIIMPNTTKSRAFTLEEIVKATQDFSQKIGQGGFGSVFFGKLEKGTNIAVKVLSMFSKQGVQEFLNEVDLLSKVDHRNLVSLLGYCIESRELMLVYEHMSGGSLKDHLYGPTADLCQLNWKTRLKIAADAAQGLEYLHVGCTQKIIHRDIKTANILLDTNFIGKLADFGLSRVTIDGEASHVTTTVKGTIGYLDPEYFSTQMLTEKSDVYSFGVVLLEIICGRQPINAKLTGEQLNLIRWVTPYVEMDENPDKLSEIIDKRLVKNYDIESITEVAKLAIRCVQMEPSSRPHVSEIVAELKEAIKLEKDKASLVSEIDIEYDDLSIASSVPKTMESAESSSSKLTTVPQEGR